MRISACSVIVLSLSLAACAGAAIVPGINPMHYTAAQARQEVNGADTPVVVIGNPFSDTDKAELDRVVGETLKNAAPDVRTRFVPADPTTAAPANGASVVIVLNPAIDIVAGNLCGKTDLPTDPARRPILAEAVFCAPGARTTSQGWLAKAASVHDPDFANLIFGTTATLFPTTVCYDHRCGF